MNMENFARPKDVQRAKGSKKYEVLDAQLKLQDEIKELKEKIKDKESEYKDRITGKNGFRDLDEKNDPLETEILAMEDKIKSLEKEIKIIPKRSEIQQLKEQIKNKEKEYKDRITGREGFRDLDQEKDPLEAQILEMEDRIRVLESEINGLSDQKNPNVETIGANEQLSSKASEAENKKPLEEAEEFGSEGESITHLMSNHKSKNEVIDEAADYGAEGEDISYLMNGRQPRNEKNEEEENYGSEGEDLSYLMNGSRLNKEKETSIEKSKEQLLMEKGYQIADEVTQLWSQLPEEDRNRPDFTRLVDCDGNGRKLFEDLVENLDDKVKAENLTEDQKLELLQGEIDIMTVYRDKIAKYLEQSKEPKENFGSEGENIKHMMDGRGKEYQRQSRIAKLREELELERKQYLQKDYEKNTAWSRMRKFFGNVGGFTEEKNLERDPELAAYRAYYDDKLLELQKLLIEDAKEHGASDEKLAEMFTEFRVEQKITLAAEHDQVKIENQEGSLGKIGQKMVGISKWYQELPMKAKVGIGLGFMAGGAVVSGLGATVGGAFASLVVARRIFGGMTTGVGTTLGLEAAGQMKDRKGVESDTAEFLESLKNLSEKDKYDLLSKQIKDVSIKDKENTIDKVKNQDLKQMSAGIAAGTLLASGVVGEIFKWIGNEVTNHFFTGSLKPSVESLVSHGGSPDHSGHTSAPDHTHSDNSGHRIKTVNIETPQPTVSWDTAQPNPIPEPGPAPIPTPETLNPPIIEAQQDFNDAHADYVRAINPVLHGEVTDAQAMHNYDAMQLADNEMKHNAEIIKGTAEYISDQKIISQSALDMINGGDPNFLKENGNYDFQSMMADEKVGPKLERLQDIYEKILEKHTGRTHMLTPKDGETLKMWLARAVKTTMEAKYGILRQ